MLACGTPKSAPAQAAGPSDVAAADVAAADVAAADVAEDSADRGSAVTQDALSSQTEDSQAAAPKERGPRPIPPPTFAPAAPRIVAIGDLHGDVAGTRKALVLVGAIDDKDSWIGGDLVVVQVGDQLDRGDDEKAILLLLNSVADQAHKAGGALYALNGNHETMNVALQFNYVSLSSSFPIFLLANNPVLPEGSNTAHWLPKNL